MNLLCESGGNGRVVPPVPFPNTAVKHSRADSTELETTREVRSPPVSPPADYAGFFVSVFHSVMTISKKFHSFFVFQAGIDFVTANIVKY